MASRGLRLNPSRQSFHSLASRSRAAIVLGTKPIFAHVITTKEIVMKYKYLKTGTLIVG